MRHFVHLSDDERSEAIATVQEAKAAFSRNVVEEPSPWGRRFKTSIGSRRKVERFAIMSLRAETLALSFRSEIGRELSKMSIIETLTDPSIAFSAWSSTWMVTKLDAWSSAIGEEADDDDRKKVELARVQTAKIAHAVSQEYDPSWRNGHLATRLLGRRSVIYLETFRDGRATSSKFHAGPPSDGWGGMTPILQGLLEAAADPYVHVRASERSAASCIKIGDPSWIVFHNSNDPIGHLRCYATIVEGARLIPPSNR